MVSKRNQKETKSNFSYNENLKALAVNFILQNSQARPYVLMITCCETFLKI